jgi:hypothetical protein
VYTTHAEILRPPALLTAVERAAILDISARPNSEEFQQIPRKPLDGAMLMV